MLYGAAEFSRDADLAILADAANLARLGKALDELEAQTIAVPPFELLYLEKGHAIHFRCRHPEAENVRIDILSRMRGVDGFPDLWRRRTTLEVHGEQIEVLSLPDLVQAKKTQRDKDWPMIARLLEADYFSHGSAPGPERIDFWLRELRTPALLIEAAGRFREASRRLLGDRPLLAHADRATEAALLAALREEEEREREADRRYWAPLRKELEQLRQSARKARP